MHLLPTVDLFGIWLKQRYSVPCNSTVRPDYFSNCFSKQLIHHNNVVHILIWGHLLHQDISPSYNYMLVSVVYSPGCISSTQERVSGIDRIGSRLGSSRAKLSDTHSTSVSLTRSSLTALCSMLSVQPDNFIEIELFQAASQPCLVSPRAPFESKLQQVLVKREKSLL